MDTNKYNKCTDLRTLQIFFFASQSQGAKSESTRCWRQRAQM